MLKISPKGMIYLSIKVNQYFTILQGSYFHESSHKNLRSFVKIKSSQKFPNLQLCEKYHYHDVSDCMKTYYVLRITILCNIIEI